MEKQRKIVVLSAELASQAIAMLRAHAMCWRRQADDELDRGRVGLARDYRKEAELVEGVVEKILGKVEE